MALRWPFTSGSRPRLRLLITALLVLSAALVWFRHDLYLSYQLASVRRSLADRDFPAAIQSLERAAEAGRNSADWHYLAARAHRRSGDASPAEKHLAQAAELGYPETEIDRQRLLLAAQSGQVHELRGKLESLTRTDVSDEAAEEIYEAMARGFLKTFDIPEAIRCLNFWVEFQPDNPLPHLWLADLYERLDMPPGAANEYAKVLELDPKRKDARGKLAQYLLIQLKLEEAETQFRQYQADFPESAEAALGLAEIARRKGDTDAAKSLIYDALSFEISDELCAQALAPLGQIAQEEQRYDEAVYLLRRSVELAPQVATSRLALAAALTANGQNGLADEQRKRGVRLREQFDRHKELLRQAVDDPDNADLHCQIGVSLLDQGLPAAAAGWLESALRIDPSHAKAHRVLARLYDQVGQRERADQHRRQADKAPQSQGSSAQD